MPSSQVSGAIQKAAGAKLRFAVDFGDEPLLIEGYEASSYDVSCPSLTVSGPQLDYPYQLSAEFSGGSAGTEYEAVYTLNLNDPDSSIVTCTVLIEVI